MRHPIFILLFLLTLAAGVNGQPVMNRTWVGSNLEYLHIKDSAADVDISRSISGNGVKYIYTKTPREHSIAFGTPMTTTIRSDTGRVWIDFYNWKKVNILRLTKDTLVLEGTYTEYSILDSIYGQRYPGKPPSPLLDDHTEPIIFIDSSKVFGDFKKFQQLDFSSPAEKIAIDSLGNFTSSGYILDASKRIKNYSFATKLKRKEFNRLVATIKETDIKRVPSTGNEPFVYDGQAKSFISVKTDERRYSFSSRHRQLYWLRSKLIFYLIRLNKKLNKERTNSPYADVYDYSN